jgi:hypothetical protein
MTNSSKQNDRGEMTASDEGSPPQPPVQGNFFNAVDDEIAARHPSIGTYLSGQRKLRGISREELCERTRIPMRSLERLEGGAFDDIDDGFVRGFVRTVSDGLGIDADDAVARMVHEPSIDSPRRVVGRSVLRAGVALAGIALLLLSAGLVNMVIELGPVEGESLVVLRRDPVRALAKAEGMWGLPETALWAPIDRSRVQGDIQGVMSSEVLGVNVVEEDAGEAFVPGPRPATVSDTLASPPPASPANATAQTDEF